MRGPTNQRDLGVDPARSGEVDAKARFSAASIVFALGTVIGGWSLLGVVDHVARSFTTLKTASLGWVLITFLAAQLCTVFVATATMASVLEPLAFTKVLALEVSNAFSALAAGTVAVLGTRVRFFQRQGLSGSVAISSAVISGTASWIAKTATVAVALPFAAGAFSLAGVEGVKGHATGQLIHRVLLLVIGVGLVAGLAYLVPWTRRFLRSTLRPKAREALAHLQELATSPVRLAALVVAAAMAQVAVAVALKTALLAFGAHLSVAACIVALTLGSVLGGISPVPGGMGVVEAGMILGVTAAGIPDQVAVSAVFIQRLCAAYLPPIWGWAMLVHLRRKEVL